jgi:hypothetical protein
LARQARSGARRGGNQALQMAAVRRFHSYLGAFIAPSVLFFALTGSLQLFTLHEAHGAYRPPALIEKLGNLHKDQVFAAKHKGPAPAPAPKRAPSPAKESHDAGPKIATLALKWFFLFVAAGLAASTGLGLWMALTHGANRRLLWILFLAGAVLPVVILLS